MSMTTRSAQVDMTPGKKKRDGSIGLDAPEAQETISPCPGTDEKENDAFAGHATTLDDWVGGPSLFPKASHVLDGIVKGKK